MKKLVLPLLCTIALVTGCESTGPKQGLGAVIGAAGGGLLGAQFGSGSGQLAATALGALGGALLGGSIGQSMDDVDRIKQGQAAAHAFESSPSGVGTKWHNPDSGHYGETIPTRTYQRSDGTYCREYTQHVNISGKSETAYGTACRQPDGSWKIVST